jgi:fructoselysine-6-P-deglycase FrlB-like protein
MQPELFLDDLLAKPAHLVAVADAIDAGGAFDWGSVRRSDRILLTGMGSSWFAAQVAALRLRRRGITAVAEIASAEHTWPVADDLAVIAISASGGSAETLDLVRSLVGARVTALTNTEASALRDLTAGAGGSGAVVDLLAGPERSGVACRSELHTLIALLALEEQLTGIHLALASACRAAAAAIEHLLTTRDRWLPAVAGRLAGPQGTWLVAPADRISSALQGALMLREVPRRQADGCETGDWSHVDVYLTKTLDYRALVFPGSRYDAEAARWMRERGTAAVAVHADDQPGFEAAEVSVTYPGGGHPLTPLLVETTVAELVAAHWLGAPA